MRKIAAFIIRMRYLVLALALIATVLSALMIGDARINYDFTKYLSKDTLTQKSLAIMKEEFTGNSALSVMLVNPVPGGAEETRSRVQAMDGVLVAAIDAENGVKTVDATEYALIDITLSADDGEAFVKALRRMLAESGTELFSECIITGDAAHMIDVQNDIAVEMPLAMLIAVIVVIAMLFLTSHAYIEPVIFMIVLAVSILINMGTNWIFESISFVTFAVAAILQLALAMDYSIILLNNYSELRDDGMDETEALIEGLARSFMPVFSSALTTVAGLAALMFMSFTIGFDIGIVLSKGILLSMLTVFLLMPALIYLFKGQLKRTAHKPVPLGGERIGKWAMAVRRAVPIVLVVLIALSAYLQSLNTYTFTDVSENAEAKRVTEVFGPSNQMVILFPKCETDEEYDMQRAMLNRIAEITMPEGEKAVSNISAMVTTGQQALAYYTAEEVSAQFGINRFTVDLFFAAQGYGQSVRADTLLTDAARLMPENETVKALNETLKTALSAFNGARYSRAIMTLGTAVSGQSAYGVLNQIISVLRDAYGEQFGVAGIAMSSYDIESAFDTDIKRVSIITILSILLIVFISFKNIAVPVILVCVIQGAIWITMAISKVLGQPIFFMCYLICTAIQMGATIDYGILTASNYRLMRNTLSPEAAAIRAMRLSLPTIFTSGIILVLAGFIIGEVCSVYYISAIGHLIARGALISILLTLFALLGLLVLADRFAMRNVRFLGRLYDPHKKEGKQ